MPSASAYLDMILIRPELENESGFRSVCRLVLGEFENHFWCQGRRPNTIAYAIAGNVLDVYYERRLPPINKGTMAKIVSKSTVVMYSITASGSKERYKKFQNELKEFVCNMKTRK